MGAVEGDRDMDTLAAHSPLADRLVRGIEAINRIGVDLRRPCGRARQERLARLIAESRAAMASGETTALQAALLSLDLFSLELCED